jgi:tRNA A-37 threonylcarbamoyl transferase component Bud32
MSWVEIMPAFETLFRKCGMESAESFLAWAGVLVNRHRHRQVEQVTLPGTSQSFYLKKEHAVTWRDRLRNAWDGFGWCATAVREGAMLQALRRAGVGCPEVVALGESGKQAFVLLRDEAGMTELRTLLQQTGDHCRLAEALGRELARLHDAGFDHPDLFAKHILTSVSDDGIRFCLLDWQRGRHRPRVSWRLRCRDLALLDATLAPLLANVRLRLRCLRSYLRATTSTAAPPLRRLALRIRAEAERLRTLRRIRDVGQMPPPAGDQAFVPLSDGAVLLVRSFHDRLTERWADGWRTMTENARQPWDLLAALARTVGADRATTQVVPGTLSDDAITVGFVQASRLHHGRLPNDATHWELPPLAHTLFRLQRFGVPAPRLLAIGCTDGVIHLITDTPKTTPLGEALAKAARPQRNRWLRQAGAIVRAIHEAGYYLPTGDSWERRLGIVAESGTVMLVQVEPLPRGTVAWQEGAPFEFNVSHLGLSRAEQMRFLSGYLRRERRAVA